MLRKRSKHACLAKARVGGESQDGSLLTDGLVWSRPYGTSLNCGEAGPMQSDTTPHEREQILCRPRRPWRSAARKTSDAGSGVVRPDGLRRIP